MRFLPGSLGPRFNLGLLAFMAVLAGAIALVVLVGFDRSQGAATSESRRGLEETAEEALLQMARDQATIGDLAAGATGQMAEVVAQYYVAARRSGVEVPWDSSHLVRDSSGRLYDSNPDRKSDLLVFRAEDVVDSGILEEIADSAVLESAFAAALAEFKSRPGQDNFSAIAVYFDSVAGFSRYYPPVGLDRTVGTGVSTADLLRDIGPEGNPQRQLRWSPPYEDAAGQGLVLTAYVPVYDGDTFLGSVGVDLSADRLVAQVNELKPSESGFGFYVDQDGKVLQTESAQVVQQAIAAPGANAFRDAVESMHARESGVARAPLNGQDVFIAFAPVSVGGSIALVAPVAERTAPAEVIKSSIESEGNRTVLGMLAVMSMLFVGALVAAAYINRRLLLQPIAALVDGTRALAAGDLDAKIAVRRNDELGVLATSFNRMAEQIRARSREAHEREEQYRSIFESTNDGMTVSRLDGRLVDVNPAMCRMHGYTKEEFLALPTGAHVHPDYRHLRASKLLGLREGQPYRVRARDIRKDGTAFDVEVLGSPVTYRGETHSLAVVRDITEQIRGEQLLEARVEERTRTLRTLLDMSQSIASAIDLQPLLGILLMQLRTLINYSEAVVMLFEGDRVRVLEGRLENGAVASGWRGRLFSIPQDLMDLLRRRESFVIPDLTADEPRANGYRQLMGTRETPAGPIRSILEVPLMLPDRVIGVLEVASTLPDAFDSSDDEVIRLVANQAASAIENARLYRELANRAREMEALARLGSAVSFDAPETALVDTVAAAAMLGTGALACAVTTLEDDEVRIAGVFGLPEGYADAMHEVWRQPGMMDIRLGYTQGNRLVIQRNYRELMRLAPQLEPMRRFVDQIEWDQIVFVPMVYGQELRGSLNFYYGPEAEITEEDQRFLKAIAAQAVFVLENIRLYNQAQSVAVLEERQRLSRELHDSVSQALYGIALGARTARQLLDRQPDRAAEPLDFVLTLAEAGIAEMRALIFELRPEALAEEGLVVALEKQGAALRARHQITVDMEFCGEPELPFAAKEALYRIAQEAMNNIVKHARATRVALSLRQDEGDIFLTVEDNGQGFNPNGEFPGHLGLKSMRERAERQRGSIDIESAPGAGAKMTARFPLAIRTTG